MPQLLGVDIGGTKTMVGLLDEAGNILAMRRFNSPPSGYDILQEIIRHGQDLLAGSREVVACGIGFGGPVDFSRQRLFQSLHVRDWENIDLCGELEAAFGVPCIIENDANAAAYGELTYGAGKGVDTFLYVTVSTGIGGGLVLERRLYRGRYCLAGEVGHLQVEPDGRPCTCGRKGCVEAYASGWALADRAKELVASHPGSALQKYVDAGTISAKHIFSAAKRGDALAQQLVGDAIAHLARGISHVVNLFDPQLIIIGGGIAQAGKAFFRPLNSALSQQLFFGHARKALCVPAALDGSSVLLGAGALALDVYRQS